MELQHYIENNDYGFLYLLAPACFLLVFVFQFFFGHKLKDRGNLLALGANGAALGISVFLYAVFGGMKSLPDMNFGKWLELQMGAGEVVRVDFSIFIDGTSALMLVLITGITLLVQIFSSEYMAKDEMRHRYWMYLGLFAFSMTSLVICSNLIFVFIFWELVGVSSYFLIGFWFKEKKPARAAQKAMILNRLGDTAFIAGLTILFAQQGYLNIVYLSTAHGDPFWMSAAGVCLLIGIFSKSAQFPLQVWLPDAMAGPTPASALIHAATMVVAGVYLLFRILPFAGETALVLAAYTGGLTAVIAAFSAIAQTDIKKVLAYSTISQLGFMVLGLGTGAYEMAFLHLVTHAFFKAGLFLAAGAIIHSLHKMQHAYPEADFDVQDIRWMGGLRKRMPWTFAFYLMCTAALAGLPFFSGFLSKDGILAGALGWSHSGFAPEGFWGLLPAIMGFTAAFLTAFYMTRHAILIFFGPNRLSLVLEDAEKAFGKIREANWKMLLPLGVLALGSIGLVFSPTHLFPHSIHDFWALIATPHFPASTMGFTDTATRLGAAEHFHTLTVWLSIGLALAGIAASWILYRKATPGMDDTRGLLGGISFSGFYLDNFYEKYISRAFLFSTSAMAWFDKRVVDGTVNFLADSFVGKTEGTPSLSESARSDRRDPRSISGAIDWVDHNVVDGAANMAAEVVGGRTKAPENEEEADKPEKEVPSFSGLAGWIDSRIIDGMVNGVANIIGRLAQGVRKLQPGKIQLYVILTVGGVLLLLLYLIYFGT